uniref:Uncharacterized protein n=1 Tax=Lepeophtheirus salmonis TaxID=72036 RepID=A0A0K2TN90_LEPSM
MPYLNNFHISKPIIKSPIPFFSSCTYSIVCNYIYYPIDQPLHSVVVNFANMTVNYFKFFLNIFKISIALVNKIFSNKIACDINWSTVLPSNDYFFIINISEVHFPSFHIH